MSQRTHTEAITFVLLPLPLHRLLDDSLPGMVAPSLSVLDAVMQLNLLQLTAESTQIPEKYENDVSYNVYILGLY